MTDLYHRYGPALRRKCERMLGNPQDAEDVVHSLFIELLDQGRDEVTLPWLYRAATHRSLNVLRDGRRRRELLAQHGGDTLVIRHGDLADRVISRDLLLRLVDQLEEPLFEVFVTVYLDRLNHVETAELMGIHRKTVAARLARIKAVVDALLEEAP